MAVKNINDDHHVVRHCKNRLLIRENGAIISVYPAAFELRSATSERPQEEYLSAIYYEFFDRDSPAEQLNACCKALPLTPKAMDGLIRLQVKRIKAQGTKCRKSLRVTHEPKKHCEAYSAIRGLPQKTDDELTGLLAAQAVVEIVEVKKVLSLP